VSRLQQILAIVAGGACIAALLMTIGFGGSAAAMSAYLFSILGAVSLIRFRYTFSHWVEGALSLLGIWAVLTTLRQMPQAGSGLWLMLLAAWAFGWLFIERLSVALQKSHRSGRIIGLLIPIVFGIWILVLWETITRGADIPTILLPPPSMIGERFANSLHILWADFYQTFLKAVISGYFLGCGSAFLAAIAIDRSPFLQRGLLPVGNFVAALPIVGIAPIIVMWFGFDWQSKAAVIVVMTFFPMLVNTITGLSASSAMQRDLMQTYAAGYWHTLFKLRLPAAAPFIFNALKINSTLALIGGIVAEFFGTPIVGMGFRISTEVGRMNIDMVWAEIAVAALAGSAFYGIIALIERAVTFWHPSIRNG